jgi:DNA end-binding protein Ku
MAKAKAKSTKSRAAPKKPAKGKERASRGARPMWSGNLRLALVSVPVNIYPATKSGARISFHQVHEPTGKRVHYEKVVTGVGRVQAADIVKGYELEKGRYILIDPEEVDALKIEARKTLDLVQFVKEGEIDPIWFDHPYYVAPDGELAEEAYGVLRDALRSSGRIGLGQFAMRGREYVAALRPCGQGILLETLRFADEVRNAKPFFSDLADDRADPELLKLAQELITRKSAPFDPSKFVDHYTEAVRQLIEAKAKKKPLVEVNEDEEPSGGAKVIDLVEALKRSVEKSERAAPKQRAG